MRFSSFAKAAALCATLGATFAAHAAPHDTNLIVNGGAEAGPGAGSSGGKVAVPGWEVTSNFTAIKYNAGGGFLLSTDPGPADRGLNFFAGGAGNGYSSARQLIDLSANGAEIAAGVLQFELSGWLGGYMTQGDYAVLTATFLDTNGAALSAAALGPVTAADRHNLNGLALRETAGFVPVGTHSVEIKLDMTRLAGAYNDGYADNLAFSVSAVPEPGTWAMLAGGLGLLAFQARRRKRA